MLGGPAWSQRARPGKAAATVSEVNTSRIETGNRLQRGPWVLLGPLKAWFTTTEGGAAINEQMQVLDQAGNTIPGLYAVGQTGLGGMVLWGHGLHIAWAMTSGRLVGQIIMQ
jgi:predicted oxidoreductase